MSVAHDLVLPEAQLNEVGRRQHLERVGQHGDMLVREYDSHSPREMLLPWCGGDRFDTLNKGGEATRVGDLIPRGVRAQTAAEYVTLMALVFVIVASLMLVSFKQQEVTIALATIRLSCVDFNSVNSSLQCYEIRYFYTGIQNITIIPSLSQEFSATDRLDLQRLMVKNLVLTFHPGEQFAGKCMTAAYYSYCIET